jgi:endonuclease/exonuclease/phosphatase family metal-dependent hydrolase
LQKYSPPNFGEVFDVPLWKKGGSDFRKQSKRFVAFTGYRDAVNVYVYHANASAKAAFLVAWVAEALRQEHDDNFLLVGDLNCDPSAVETALRDSGADPDDFHFANGGKTHNAKLGVTKTYDYAIAGSKVNVTVDVLDISKAIDQYSSAVPATQDMSDHLPIVVSFI